MSKSGVRNLEARTIKGKTYYVYQPTKSARDAGLFQDKRTSFGQDFETAKAAAEEYNKILDRWLLQGKTVKAVKKESNTFEAAVDRFMRSREYRKLSQESRKNYEYHLRRVCGIKLPETGGFFGQVKMDSLRRPIVRELCDEIERKHGKHAMGFSVSVCKRLCNVAQHEWEIIDANPFERMGVSNSNRRKNRWTQAQVYHFYSEAIKDGRRSIGMVAVLCYELVQRHVDMRFIKKEQVKEYPEGLMLEVTQSKTGTTVHLDCEHIRAQIEESMEANDSEYLCAREDTGQPWINREYFAAVAREIMNKAGLPKTLQIRDLRRSGALEMVEAGATHQQLKDQGGWLSDAPVTHYTPRGTETARAGQLKRLKKRKKTG